MRLYGSGPRGQYTHDVLVAPHETTDNLVLITTFSHGIGRQSLAPRVGALSSVASAALRVTAASSSASINCIACSMRFSGEKQRTIPLSSPRWIRQFLPGAVAKADADHWTRSLDRPASPYRTVDEGSEPVSEGSGSGDLALQIWTDRCYSELDISYRSEEYYH